MDDFIKFSDFQKTVNFTPIKMWRVFKKLRDGDALKKEIDWRMESGELYVIPSRLFVEAKKLRPELEFVKSVKSNEINQKSEKSEESSRNSDKTISNDFKTKSNDNKRNHTISDDGKSEIIEILKGQINSLENDKQYLQNQLKEKTDEVKNINRERAYLLQDWRNLVGENDELRRQLTSGESEIKPKSVRFENAESVVSEEPMPQPDTDEVGEQVEPATPPESPQNDQSKEFTPGGHPNPSSEPKTPTDANPDERSRTHNDLSTPHINRDEA